MPSQLRPGAALLALLLASCGASASGPGGGGTNDSSVGGASGSASAAGAGGSAGQAAGFGATGGAGGSGGAGGGGASAGDGAAGAGGGPGAGGSNASDAGEAAETGGAAPGASDGGRVAEGGGPQIGSFELSWEDNFDSFDSQRWQLMTHSWDGNLAQFSTQNTSFADGIASLQLTSAPGDTAKPFRGVEMRSRATVTYGKVETRARFAKGSGVVSAFVLIYTPFPADDWNELDVEYLGRNADKVQFNAMVYTGPPVAKPATKSVTPTQSPQLVTLAADGRADFHVYGIEWTNRDVRFTVDGDVKHTWSANIAKMHLPQNILLTIWASSTPSWAGPIQTDTAPSQADYDWVRVYSWKP